MLSDLRYRLRALFRRDAMDRELDEELRFHLEHEIEKHVRAGVPRAEAERRARLEFGGVDQIKEDTREVRGVALLDGLLRDVRYAWRGMRARPGFAAAVVLTLGLGIGANAAMFGIIDRLLFRPPPFLESAERVHRLYLHYVLNGRPRVDRAFAYLHYRQLEESTTSFDAVTPFAYPTLAVGTGEAAREMTVMAAGASLFDHFAARPVLGRFFTSAEDVPPTGTRVAVLSHGFWQAEYGGSAEVLGASLQIGTAVYTIIGVAPPEFVGTDDFVRPAMFVPLTAYAYSRSPDYTENYNWSWLGVLVRRRPDVSLEVASADVNAAFLRGWEIEHRLGRAPPAADAAVRGEVAPIQLQRGPDAGPESKVAAWVMGVAIIVLLIACANVINLLLARAVHRRREIALRLALGVSRGGLLRQLTTETMLLALLGGAVGVAIAQWGGRVLHAQFLPGGATVAVATDARTLLFVMTITLALALLTGLAPALQAVRADVGETLKAGARDTGYRSSRLRTSLLLFQAALSVILLVGAGLFVRSLANVRGFRLGYDVEPNIALAVNLRGENLSAAQGAALADRLLAAAVTVPGVQSATLAASVPFWSNEGRGTPFVPGVDSVARLGRFTLQAGTPDYFETLGTRILRGRGFTEHDRAGTRPVVVVNEAMARALWPDDEALGKQLRFGADTMPFLTVIGVAEDMRGLNLTGGPEFWYYLPYDQYAAMYGSGSLEMFVRVDGRADEYVERVRQRLQREMPGAAYVTAVPFHALVAPRQRAWEFGATMFVAFATLALVLAAVGLYSVCAYGVAQRTRELGVRIALGASTAAVVRLVVRQGALFAVTGIAIGGALALLAARPLEPLLFSASARDPVVYGGVAAILVLVALVATIRPALRATRVDPTIALRAE
ncbi:MAG TPA: ADOP family duplicated permease [Longimicrobiales bacterium]